MRILAFDTSHAWCSVAVGGDSGWLEREIPTEQTQSERVLPMAQALLQDAGWTLRELDAIAYGAGPGSFTGVRIACGVAQGLAFGLGCPVLGVATLAAIAHQARAQSDATAVLAGIDARMKEIYVAAYGVAATAFSEMLAPLVARPADVQRPPGSERWVAAGNAFAVYPDLAPRLGIHAVLPDVRPTGRAVGELALPRLLAGEGVDAASALPLYVRHRVALTTTERAAGVRL